MSGPSGHSRDPGTWSQYLLAPALSESTPLSHAAPGPHCPNSGWARPPGPAGPSLRCLPWGLGLAWTPHPEGPGPGVDATPDMGPGPCTELGALSARQAAWAQAQCAGACACAGAGRAAWRPGCSATDASSRLTARRASASPTAATCTATRAWAGVRARGARGRWCLDSTAGVRTRGMARGRRPRGVGRPRAGDGSGVHASAASCHPPGQVPAGSGAGMVSQVKMCLSPAQPPYLIRTEGFYTAYSTARRAPHSRPAGQQRQGTGCTWTLGRGDEGQGAHGC